MVVWRIVSANIVIVAVAERDFEALFNYHSNNKKMKKFLVGQFSDLSFNLSNRFLRKKALWCDGRESQAYGPRLMWSIYCCIVADWGKICLCLYILNVNRFKGHLLLISKKSNFQGKIFI